MLSDTREFSSIGIYGPMCRSGDCFPPFFFVFTSKPKSRHSRLPLTLSFQPTTHHLLITLTTSVNMVAMEWTPRLESAFKRLQDRKKSLSSTSTSFTPDETKTTQEVDAFLADTKTKECVDLDLLKRVSALLLKYSSSTGDAGGVGGMSLKQRSGGVSHSCRWF